MHIARTLQGLNLESDISIIEIPLKDNTEEIFQILEKIKSFHPIFLESYSFENETLSIESNLPFIWRDCAEILVKLSKKEMSKQETEEYIIEKIINKKVKSMSTIPILYSAHKMRLETTLTIIGKNFVDDFEKGYSSVFNRYYTIGCGKGSHVTCSISSSRDAHISQKIQRDKWVTNTVIQRLGLPQAKWDVVDTETELEKVWKNFEKPVVIKPTGLTGGSGVTVGINTLEEAKKAFKYAKKMIDEKVRSTWQKKIMIQEQLKGEDYRLLVVGGVLEIATKRIPAFIIGNGKNTIKELIEETNRDPRRNIKNPAHTLKPIEIDDPLLDLLKEEKVSLDTVLQDEQKLYVRKVASMSRGGVTEDFTDSVSPEIKYIVESLAQSIHAYVLGVDVMCEDLSKPLTKENGGIIEINTMPESYLNFYPTIGKQRDYVADTYVKKLLKDNSTKRIVMIGQIPEDLSTILRRKNTIGDTERVGELKNNDLIINNAKLNEIEDKWDGIEALKLNSSLDSIIIHYRDWEDVKENGLGFNKIDYLYITKPLAKEREYFKILKKYKRKGYIDKIKKI